MNMSSIVSDLSWYDSQNYGFNSYSFESLSQITPSCKINVTDIKRSFNLTDTDIFLIIGKEELQLLRDSKELKRIKISNIIHQVTATVPYFGTCLVDLIINYL
jgi:hypothetical protein